MSTHASIGMRKENGDIVSIYCHYDGFPDTVGVELVAKYPGREQVEALIALGDISSLVPDVVAYHRDRGEPFSKVAPVNHIADGLWRRASKGLSFRYLWEDGTWRCWACSTDRECEIPSTD